MGRNTCLYFEMKGNQVKQKIFFKEKDKMTISSSPVIITCSDWILERSQSITLSGNKIKSIKTQYPQEIPRSLSLVASLKVGDHTLETQKGWTGLSQNNEKFVTLTDVGRATIRDMASTLILNTTFQPTERECPIEFVNYVMFGASTDDARVLKQYRYFFIRGENEHFKSYLSDWCMNSMGCAEELIAGLINLRLYITLDDFYSSFGSWSKLLAMYCRRDKIELPTQISPDATKMIVKGLIFVRKQSKVVNINTLNFRVNQMFWEGDRLKNIRIYTIERNNVCMPCFVSEEFNGQVRLDENNFITVKFKLKLIEEEITALCLCLDGTDAMDMIESESTPLQTIAIGLPNSLIICVIRRLPSFVELQSNLKVDPNSSDLIYKDELLNHVITNLHVNLCGVPSHSGYNRYELIRPVN